MAFIVILFLSLVVSAHVCVCVCDRAQGCDSGAQCSTDVIEMCTIVCMGGHSIASGCAVRVRVGMCVTVEGEIEGDTIQIHHTTTSSDLRSLLTGVHVCYRTPVQPCRWRGLGPTSPRLSPTAPTSSACHSGRRYIHTYIHTSESHNTLTQSHPITLTQVTLARSLGEGSCGRECRWVSAFD